MFDAETSESFEWGIKKDFREYDLRINAAAHYTTVEDFQGNTFTDNGFNLQNAVDYGYVQGDFSHTSDILLDGSNDPYAIQDGYNVVNLRLLMNVEEQDMDVVVWARNLLDEECINRTNFNALTSTLHYKRAN